MTAPLNGHPIAPDPAADQMEAIAKLVIASFKAEGAEQSAWEDLSAEDKAGEQSIAEHYVIAHLRWLTEHGFKVIPPGATPVPKTDDEALAMVAAAKSYFDAKKRKGGLMTGAVGRKLIVPGGRMQ